VLSILSILGYWHYNFLSYFTCHINMWRKCSTRSLVCRLITFWWSILILRIRLIFTNSHSNVPIFIFRTICRILPFNNRLSTNYLSWLIWIKCLSFTSLAILTWNNRPVICSVKYNIYRSLTRSNIDIACPT